MKTKVILIHNSYLSARNGANTVMRSLLESSNQFAKYDIELRSLSPDSSRPRSFEPNSTDAAMNLRRAKIKKWLKSLAQKSCLAADLMMYLSEFRPSRIITLKYISSKPDKDEIVFFHSLIPCYYYLKHRKFYQKTIVVCHTNGDNFKMDRMYYSALEKSYAYKKMLKMEKFVIEHADRINFVAELAKNNFLKLHPEADANKVSFIYNGIPDRVFGTRNMFKRPFMEFCCVASISLRKGQHFIIDALKQLYGQIPNVHFTFVGDGPDRERLQKEVEDFNLTKYVTFAGISYDVDKFLETSDAYILPSVDEGLPMAIIEAMRASLPIVSTPVGGIPEMIEDRVNGLIIEPNDRSIKELLLHLEEYNWESMGVKSRETFENKFSITEMVNGYARLLTL